MTEPNFLPNFGQKAPQNSVFCIFFLKSLSFVFLKTIQNVSSFDSWLSIANHKSGKVVLELLPIKMFLANQIAVFFKVQIYFKRLKDKVHFCLQINIRVSYKLVLFHLVGMVRHAQSVHNNKFAISSQYFKKEVRDKYDFLHEDKHQSILQAGSIVFTSHSQTCPKYPK